jgi:hypothetical protein
MHPSNVSASSVLPSEFHGSSPSVRFLLLRKHLPRISSLKKKLCRISTAAHNDKTLATPAPGDVQLQDAAAAAMPWTSYRAAAWHHRPTRPAAQPRHTILAAANEPILSCTTSRRTVFAATNGPILFYTTPPAQRRRPPLRATRSWTDRWRRIAWA